MATRDQTIGYHMGMSRTQTLVQLNQALLARLDERAAREKLSRSALIRAAIERYLEDELAAEVDRRIVEAYTRIPQTAAEDAWAEAAARDAVAEEPW
jgi:metal-responsive CopG/Arc/MetJ family transcriptional regulator